MQRYRSVLSGVLFFLFFLVPISVGAFAVDDDTKTRKIDDDGRCHESFLTTSNDKVLLFCNYEAGDFNSERFFKVFRSADGVSGWEDVTNKTPFRTFPASVVSVKPMGKYVYLLTAVGAAHDAVQLWRVRKDSALNWKIVKQWKGSFSGVTMTRYKKQVRIYGMDQEDVFSGYVLKNGKIETLSVSQPITGAGSVNLLSARTFNGKVLLYGLIDWQLPVLLKASDGKKFSEVAPVPFTRNDSNRTAETSNTTTVSVGSTQNSGTSIWTARRLSKWNRICRRDDTKQVSFETDTIYLAPHSIFTLTQRTPTADPEHPSLVLHRRKSGKWSKKYEFNNTGSGSDMMIFKDRLIVVTNHNNGPRVTTFGL